MRGREGDWQLNWGQEGPRTLVTGLALAGFDAVTINRLGYLDRGTAFQRSVSPLLGQPHRVGNALEWYDLRPLRAQLVRTGTSKQLAHAKELLLHAAVPAIHNPQPPLSSMQPGLEQWFEQRSAVIVRNPLAEDRRVKLDMVLSARVPSTMSIDGPGLHRTLRIGPAPRHFALPVTLRGGETQFAIMSTAPVDVQAPVLRQQRVFTAAIRVDRLMIVDPAVIERVEAVAANERSRKAAGG